ncbi:DegT/DnrJ/EryC1/StrS family aminotransferase [Roseateles sp. P5_E11]
MSMRLLIPDLPCADALMPWLRRIDAARQYGNFGPLVRELEATLAAHWPVASIVPVGSDLHVRTASSGTAALELAMAALDLPRGGEVLMPAFTFPATAAAALRQGLRVLFADVAEGSWQLSPVLAREVARHRRLALVMPVATFGRPLDAAAWDAFSKDTGVPVLMDAAAAFGNQAVGHRACAAFSLHATKPFGIGEGGLVATRDAALAERVARLSNFGFEGGRAAAVAGNAKMSEYAAAVALCQWARRGALRERRRVRWPAYSALLDGLPGVARQTGFDVGDALPANLVLMLPVAAAPVAAALAREGIETRRWYCPPLPAQPAFAACPVVGELPVTAALAGRSLGLPWHGFLTEADLDQLRCALATHVVPALMQEPAGHA